MVNTAIIQCPGFVDLQVNGYLGVDFTDPELTETLFIDACEALFKQGTTAFLPTLITSPMEIYARNLPLIAGVVQRPRYQGRLLGIHLEGPFISRLPGAVGAHDPEFVLEPEINILKQLITLARGTVKLLTVAAELPGIHSVIQYATSKGIAASIGHSLFDTPALELAVNAGATALTHLGNGLPNVLPRHPNPLWAGLSCDELTAMFITDGHHLPAEVMKVALRVKGPERFIVVSDASPVAGLPPGRYTFSNNDAILEPSGRFYNPVKQCLVGSSATMMACMNHLASLGALSLDELLRVGVYNPLALIGLSVKTIDSQSRVAFESQGQRFFLSDNVSC